MKTWRGFSPREPVDYRLCQTATTPRHSHVREIPLQDVDCAIYVGVDDRAAGRAGIPASGYSAGFASGFALAAVLTGVVLTDYFGADTKQLRFVSDQASDLAVRPLVESLITGVAPVLDFAFFVCTHVFQVTNYYGGDTASVSIVDYGTGQAMQEVVSLAGSLAVEGFTLSGSAVVAYGFLLLEVSFHAGKFTTRPKGGCAVCAGGGTQYVHAEIDC